MKKKLISMLLIVVMTLGIFNVLAGCGNNNGSTGGGITKITITGRPTGDTVYFQDGTTFALDFTWEPGDKDVPEIVWTSSNESVATVSTASGIKVRQRGIGDTTIKATVKNTTVSDSFELHIIEAPTTEITVDGETVSVGFQAFGTNVDPAMATVSEDKKELTLDTGDVYSSGLGIWLFMPEGKELNKTQVYEVKVTAVVSDLSMDYGEDKPATALEVRTGAPLSDTFDWARYCQWPGAMNITGTGTFNFHGIFTTGDTDAGVSKWTVIKFNNVAPYSVSTKYTIKNIELKKVVPERARLQAQWESTYKLSDFDNNATVTATRRFVTLNGEGNEQLGLGVALKTVFYSSDPEVIQVTDTLNGKIKGIKEGIATLHAYVEGVYDPDAPAASNGFITISKEIQIINAAEVTATVKINGVNRVAAVKAKTSGTLSQASVDDSMLSVTNTGGKDVITFDSGKIHTPGTPNPAQLLSSPVIYLKLPFALETNEMYFLHFKYKMKSLVTYNNTSSAAAARVAYSSQFGIENKSNINAIQNVVIDGSDSTTMDRARNCVLTAKEAGGNSQELVLFWFTDKLMDFEVDIYDIEINKLDDTNCVVKIADANKTAAIGSKNLEFSIQYIGEGAAKNALVNAFNTAGVFVTWTSSDTSKLTVTNKNTWVNITDSRPSSLVVSTMTGVAAGSATLSMSFDIGSITTGAAGSAMSVTVTVG